MLKHFTVALVASAVILTGCLAEAGKKRPPMVADSFYPANPDLLGRMVDDYLASAKGDNVGQVVGIVVPHAGYIYSGQVAAYAFAQLKGRQVSRVVVIAPSHLERIAGASIYNGDAYQTPLGEIPVDTDFARKLAAQNPRLRLSGAGHDVKDTGRTCGAFHRGPTAFPPADAGRPFQNRADHRRRAELRCLPGARRRPCETDQ